MVNLESCRDKNEWQKVSLSDVDSVKGLLKLRSHFDLLYDMSDTNPLSSNVDLTNQIDEITCTYAWLDEVMADVKFTSRQRVVLDKYLQGYEVEEIAIEEEQSVQNVHVILNRMCQSIVDEAHRKWTIWAQIHKLGVETKICKRCGETLPVNNTFFSLDSRNKDGFKSYCKKCHNEK